MFKYYVIGNHGAHDAWIEERENSEFYIHHFSQIIDIFDTEKEAVKCLEEYLVCDPEQYCYSHNPDHNRY